MMKLLYSDAQVLIIDKPANLLVHKSVATAVHEPTVIDRLWVETNLRLKPVHRLDRATSGVLLLARTSEAAAFYGKQFEERTVTKKYLAIARGFIKDQVIDHPLKRLGRDEKLQDAQTILKVLSQVSLPFACGRYSQSRYSMVELNPLSGRRHQLRRHLKHISHPIVGDTTYGDGVHNQLFRNQFNCHRLLLHCSSLSFTRLDGQRITIESALDGHFRDILKHFESTVFSA
jgi:tRNA pseudouridine65 synthase